MKKKLLIIPIVIVLCSCKSQNLDTQKNGSITSLWDVPLILEYDDVDTWLTTRVANGGGYNNEGIYTSVLDSFNITYNREDFYNENGKYRFVLGSFEKGGAIVYKKDNDSVGIVKSDGTVAFPNTLGYITTQTKGLVFDEYNNGKIIDSFTLSPDYKKKEIINDNGLDYSIGISVLFFDRDRGFVCPKNDHDIETMTSRDLFNEAVNEGYINKNNYMVVNTYASFIDCRKYLSSLAELHNTEEGYFVVGNNYYKKLSIANNYIVKDFSDGIITFTRSSKTPEIGDDLDYKFSQQYYSYELCYLDTVFDDVTYVNTDGDIIASGFEDGYGFYEGYAAVKKNGKWGYIDKNGDVVVDFFFDKATPLSDGKSWITYKGKTGKINLKSFIDNDGHVYEETFLS